ncbi:TPA: DNA cytosine methyltransferase [Pseudomonas aeruginosa]|nr:DNA cytosine methyltransferase [Pseudomonas aeruginosa]
MNHSFTTVLNVKIGESKCVPRLWMEGEALARAGLKIDTRYRVQATAEHRIELREVPADYKGESFKVSSRNRHGVQRPLMEVRSRLLRAVFESCEKVRVAIRKGVIVITAHQLELNIIERSQRVLKKVREGAALAVCSLFHAGGVMDKALHHGFALGGLSSFVKVAVELSSVYLSSSLRNNPELWQPDSVVIQSDIRDTNWRNSAPACDVLVAGIPCNAASKAGISKNELEFAEEHDDAGTLFVDFLEGVKASNPALIVAENVPEYQNTAGMAVIRSVLGSLGYQVFESVLNGNDFGALERRRRLVVVAVCKGLSQSFDFSSLSPVKTKEATLSEVLDAVPLDSDRWKTYAHLETKAIKDKEAGKGFARQLLTGAEGFCGTVGKGYFKGRSTEPFIQHPENPGLSRLFTPLEHARIKGIPECVFAGEAETVAHEIMGQAVVYPQFVSVGAGIARMLRAALLQNDAHPQLALAA